MTRITWQKLGYAADGLVRRLKRQPRIRPSCGSDDDGPMHMNKAQAAQTGATVTGPETEAGAVPGSSLPLAIMTGGIDVASETFIRAHIHEIAPGQTLVLTRSAPQRLVDVPFVQIPPAVRHERSPAIRKGIGVLDWMRTGSRAAFDRRQEEVAYEALVRFGAQVVLAEYGPNGCAIARAARRAGAELVVHFHGYDASILLRSFRWRYEYRRLAKIASEIVAPSRYLADRLVEMGFPEDRVHVVPCGVDPRNFPFVERRPDSKRVLAVGRLVEKKGPLHLIRAFRRVADIHEDAVLDLAGDGPLMPQCRDLVRTLGLEGRVRLHGVVDHEFVKKAMREATLFAQHSLTAANGDVEGLPVAIMEAMMSGLPVVSTRHSGIPEAVVDGETGLLVKENDVQGMADCMNRLLSDVDLRASLGRKGRTRAIEKFEQQQTIARLRGILGLASGTTPRRAGRPHVQSAV